MKAEKPTIVLFDMDGTTVRHINPRMLGALEFLDDVIFKASLLFSKDKPVSDFKETMEKPPRLLVHRALHKIRRKPIEQIVQPCPGIVKLLELLQSHNIPMGIVSNGLGKGYGHEILETFGLSKFFQAQIFREDIQNSKPHPEPILRALNALNVHVTKEDVIWYIGDRHKDVVAALAANDVQPAKVVPFAYGLKASIAILEKTQNPEQIIVNYPDFTRKITQTLNA